MNYVELSKRGDFNPSTNYYFWYLDLPRLKAALLEHLYHAEFNLKKRRTCEIEKDKEILEFAVISEHDQKRQRDLIFKIHVLDQSIENLDKTIMLMEKF